jgi:hypothetical protein
MNNDMNQALIFMGVCFGLGVGMILWRVVVSEALRDWKICACAKKSRKGSTPVEVIINYIQIPGKFEYRPDFIHLDIQVNETHWYFSDCSFPIYKTAISQVKDGDIGKMYTAKTDYFTACYIETSCRTLLGSLSAELPKVESWKKYWFYN